MRKISKKSYGFTLIEIMIAIAVLAIGMTAVYFAVHFSVRADERAKQHIAEHLVADNVYSKLKLNLLPMPIKSELGSSIMLGSKYDWSVRKIGIYNNAFTVKITVSDDGQSQASLIGFIAEHDYVKNT